MTLRHTFSTAVIAALVSVLGGCGVTEVRAPSTQQSPSPRATLAVVSADPFTSSILHGLRAEVDVRFTEVVQCGSRECTVPLDVLAPREGEMLPTLVLVPGGPVEFHFRRYLDVLAAGIARRGAVVFLTTYRSSATSNRRSDSLDDVRCSVRYARSVTGDYGGDPERVVLVGTRQGPNLCCI